MVDKAIDKEDIRDVGPSINYVRLASWGEGGSVTALRCITRGKGGLKRGLSVLRNLWMTPIEGSYWLKGWFV